ncbi:MAG: SGNH/GDSL hydrolase family protein [Acidobacteriota bacterium]
MEADVKLDETTGAKPQVKLSRTKRFLFTLVIFLIFLLALEGALRVLDIPRNASDLRQDRGLMRKVENSIGHAYKPGWSGYHAGGKVHINSVGWRGKEFSIEKPPDTIRLLGIGDSFTFGRAVDDEDIFLVKLEAMLNSDAGARYEAINAGHENVNTVKELRYFKEKEMLKLRPDVVVLGFTVHNDAQIVKNRTLYRRYRRRASLPLRMSESEWFKDMADSVRLARVLRAGIEWAYHDQLTEVYYQIVLSNYEDDSRSWNACREALLGFQEICLANKVPLIVALFPVYTRELDQTYKDYPEGFRRVHDKLKSVFEGREGVTVVDMLDTLADSGLTINEIRVPIDGHPNRVWHEIVARKLYETIKGMGLKPESRNPPKR